MIKTITIIDNEDEMKTQKVYFNNFNGEGSIIEIDKADIKFDMNYERKLCEFPTANMILKVNCKINSKGELFRVINMPIIDRFTDNELLNELKKRKVIIEETIYKIN